MVGNYAIMDEKRGGVPSVDHEIKPNQKQLTMMSLFDGSGSFPLAGAMHGIIPVSASEIEPYPIAVSRSHFPSMKHLGSVTEIKGGDAEAVDVITFGSP
jgi:DNA (cytosine-5)-methyltransferase 1